MSKEDRERILCPECETEKKQPWWDWRVAVYPKQEEVQQSSMQTGIPKSIVKEKDKQRDVRRMFKMLREVWLNIEVKKIDTHEGITVKALLNSGATGIFIDKKMAAKHEFRLQKLKRPVMVRNVDGMNNSRRTITYQVEVNVYYKSHVKRMRIDVCDLERIDVILEMP